MFKNFTLVLNYNKDRENSVFLKKTWLTSGINLDNSLEPKNDMVVNSMNHQEQLAWQKEVIHEELLDSIAEKGSVIDDLDEEALEDLILKKRKLQ